MIHTTYRSPFHPFNAGPDASPDLSLGRRCLPKVPSLLFDLEMEDVGKGEGDENDVDDALRELRSLAEPWADTELTLVHCVLRARETAIKRGRELDLVSLATCIREQGFDVRVRTALGGGVGGECLRNLRHEFLACTQQGIRPTTCIVDLSFTDQFAIAEPSPRYRTLLAALPCALVVCEDRIAMLVRFLCREMRAAFQLLGKAVPPWRQQESMLSKWRPRRSVDHDPDGSLREAARAYVAREAHARTVPALAGI